MKNAKLFQYVNDSSGVPMSIRVITDEGQISVPLDPFNRYYAEIMNQVDAGELVIEPDPGPTKEKIAVKVRSERDRLLKDSDWTQLPDAPVNHQVWSDYRHELRDLPEQAGFPTDIDWPEKPE